MFLLSNLYIPTLGQALIKLLTGNNEFLLRYVEQAIDIV